MKKAIIENELFELQSNKTYPGVDFTKLCLPTKKDTCAQRLARNVPFKFNLASIETLNYELIFRLAFAKYVCHSLNLCAKKASISVCAHKWLLKITPLWVDHNPFHNPYGFSTVRSNEGREDQVDKPPYVGNQNTEIRILSHRIFKRSSEDDESNSKKPANSTDELIFIFNLKKNECVDVKFVKINFFHFHL